MPELVLVSANGGGPASPPPQEFRKHRLADAVWDAVCPDHAPSIKAILERIREGGQRAKYSEVNAAINHIRHHAEEYGWTLSHVGADKSYFPILVDPNDPRHRVYMVGPAALRAVTSGSLAAIKRIRTQARHQAMAVDLFIDNAGSRLSRRQRQQLRSCAAMMVASAELATPIIEQLETEATA